MSTEPDSDPRNKSDSDYPTMPGTFVDSAHNMPGDQPEDDTPPSKMVADGTADPDDQEDEDQQDPDDQADSDDQQDEDGQEKAAR